MKNLDFFPYFEYTYLRLNIGVLLTLGPYNALIDGARSLYENIFAFDPCTLNVRTNISCMDRDLG